jgi:hypothetical protein
MDSKNVSKKILGKHIGESAEKRKFCIVVFLVFNEFGIRRKFCVLGYLIVICTEFFLLLYWNILFWWTL